MEEGGGAVNPYAAPESPVDLAPGWPAEVGGFRSVTPLAQAITVLMALITLFRILQSVNGFVAISVLNRVLAQQPFEQSELVAIDRRAMIVGVAEPLLVLVAAVLYCFFMPRANRNIRAFGAGPLKFTPRWSAGCFFVPIVSLYQPYDAMKELWLGSDPDWQPSSWWRERVPSLFRWWWGTFLVAGIAGMLGGMVFLHPQGVPDFIARSWFGSVVSILGAAAAVLAAGVVRAVASRQEERQRRLLSGTAG